MRVVRKDRTFERHLPASAVVFNSSSQVLLAKRFGPNEKYHDMWNFPGGGIEFGENPKDTAIRETFEETGITINVVFDYPIVVNEASEEDNEDSIGLIYVAEYQSGEIDTSSDHGTSEAKWFNISDIDYNQCLPFTKEIINQALKILN
jgi:ADP-ribose pyrophosphatase YjhB (NUDIX family)